MLIIPPPRRKQRGRTPQPAAPSAPPLGVLVTSVSLVDATSVLWHFSSSYSGDSTCAALTLRDGTSGWTSPAAVEAPDDTSILAYYVGVTLNLSTLWQLLTQIDGLTFADGLLAVPQSGVVVGV
jgi:hypothetical protein